MTESLESSSDLDRALARLSQLIDWERSDRRADMGRNLGPVRDLLQRLGDPQRSFRAVHVAGTKGKSTTAALISAGLRQGGFRTGSYSSPHVERVNERVRIDGAEIESDLLARSIETALDAREELPSEAPARRSTYFDVLTAAAFVALAEAEVEWAVIECGLGGRLDSTNAVRGDVCVITTIDLEHTEVLGETRALIAGEKAGILKSPKSSLVCGVPRESEAGEVIHEAAERFSCPEVWVKAPPGATIEERNAAVARAALDELGRRGLRTRRDLRVDGSFLDDATLRAARLPGRQELFSFPHPEGSALPAVRVALDGGHVASSIEEWLRELPGADIPML
ncbi:MAG: Mur ligase family protein, partial [Planctomycetota bacterium]